MPRGAPLITRWFDGRSPKARAARVWVDGDTLVVVPLEEGATPTRHPLSGVRWPERRTHGQRQTELPDGGLLQHADAAAWDDWWLQQELGESFVVGWTQSWRGVLVALCVTVLVLMATWQWGVPWVSERVAHGLPPAVEQRIGAESMDQLERGFLQPSTLPPAQQAALRKRWQSMVGAAFPNGDAPTHELAFRASPRLGPNAFALPGGQIVVTDELVKLLDDHPEVLMGVLGHELGHVRHRDGLDMLVRSTFLSAIVGVVFGDMGGFIASVPAALLTQSYSRDAERRADLRAAELLHANGVSPAVMATLFERLGEFRRAKGGGDALPIAIASHPDDEARVQFFRQWSPADGQP
ncbi:MAG: M48 family metallopeptidase [Hydrogenophaga sp.]|uniref:M48 family metallopeptidase n=1 Tax=Hydrogenophaga sp. TaxID=1904254 RepID=UPI001DBAADB8|nr:M48 family metallopeptidase [Hydrogenophaga sp.]MBX3611013.1 M48 family metallopeptidase [Hydrogenophaga sp.]